MLFLLLPVVLLCATLPQVLEAQAGAHYQTMFRECGRTATAADWNVLWRARDLSRCVATTRRVNKTFIQPAARQPRQTQRSHAFVLDLNALTVPLSFQTRNFVVPISAGTWSACVAERMSTIGCGQALLANPSLEAAFALNGKALPKDYDLEALVDATIRLRLSGLLGGRRDTFSSEVRQVIDLDAQTPPASSAAASSLTVAPPARFSQAPRRLFAQALPGG